MLRLRQLVLASRDLGAQVAWLQDLLGAVAAAPALPGTTPCSTVVAA